MSTITMMEIGGWLRSLGLEQYEAAFHANAVDADVLRDLTDQDLQKLGVLLGHRHRLLQAIATLNGTFAAKSPPRRPGPLPIGCRSISRAPGEGRLLCFPLAPIIFHVQQASPGRDDQRSIFSEPRANHLRVR
jgi:hypothetical protein